MRFLKECQMAVMSLTPIRMGDVCGYRQTRKLFSIKRCQGSEKKKTNNKMDGNYK
jgi:copper oxidase (laccase) domain-containing protein